MWNLVTTTYTKFVTFRSFFKTKNENSTRKKHFKSIWIFRNQPIHLTLLLCKINISNVVFMSCGFLHPPPPPPTILTSYFHLLLWYFRNFSSLIFHLHISYIPHFPSSWSFFRFFFLNALSSGFPTLFLLISFQLSSLSVGHHIFPIRGQLCHAYFFCAMSHSQFSSLLDCFSAFSKFGATYFTHVMYTKYQISNFLLVCFFFTSPFSVTILPFHCLRISVPPLNTRPYLQNIVFPEFFFNSKVSFPFHLSSRLFAIRFQEACFSFCLFPWLQARHADALL